MKKLTAIASFAIASLAVAGTSFAQDHAVKANIPFGFTAGSQSLPAGRYIINAYSGNLVVLRNLDKPIRVVTVALHEHGVDRSDRRLVFNRHGDQYFLRSILCYEANLDLVMPTTRQEQRIRRQEASVDSNGQINVAVR